MNAGSRCVFAERQGDPHMTDQTRRAPSRAVTAAAGLIVAAEALGLAALACWELIALLSGDTDSAISSIALLVLTGVGAVIVLAFAAGILRGRSWARSGGIVTQLLILAVAIGAATGQYAHPLIGLALAAPAVVGLVLLVLASRAAGRSARGDSAGG